jgi:hypothetical protein
MKKLCSNKDTNVTCDQKLNSWKLAKEAGVIGDF